MDSNKVVNVQEDPNFRAFYSTRVMPDGKYQSILLYGDRKGLAHQELFATREEAAEFSKEQARLKGKLYISEDSGFVTIATVGFVPDEFVAVYIGLTSDTIDIVGEGIVGTIETAKIDGIKYAQEKTLPFMNFYGFSLIPQINLMELN